MALEKSMELNREELKTILRVLQEKLDTINNNVHLMDYKSDEFGEKVKYENELRKLHDKIFNELQPDYSDVEILSFD